jgi:hypothetical protein
MLTKKKFHDIFIVAPNNSMGLDILHRIGDGWPIVPLIRDQFGVPFKEYTLF